MWRVPGAVVYLRDGFFIWGIMFEEIFPDFSVHRGNFVFLLQKYESYSSGKFLKETTSDSGLFAHRWDDIKTYHEIARKYQIYNDLYVDNTVCVKRMMIDGLLRCRLFKHEIETDWINLKKSVIFTCLANCKLLHIWDFKIDSMWY